MVMSNSYCLFLTVLSKICHVFLFQRRLIHLTLGTDKHTLNLEIGVAFTGLDFMFLSKYLPPAIS